MNSSIASKSIPAWQSERASAPRKSRPDSRLKMLALDRKKEIRDYAGDHSLAETVSWLSTAGFKTSNASLSRFLSDFSKPETAESDVLLDVVIQSTKPVRLVVRKKAGAVNLQTVKDFEI